MSGFLDKLNLKPHERRLVVIVGIVVFAVLNFWFVFPVFGELGRNQQRIRDARTTLDQFQREVDKKADYERELAQLRGQGLIIPSAEQAGQLMREVQTQATLNQVNLTRYDASPRALSSKTNSFFDEQTLVVSLTSSGEKELIEFLYNLSSRETLTRVRNMNLSPDPPRQKLSGNITLVRSYQKASPSRTTARATPTERSTTNVTPSPITSRATNAAASTSVVAKPTTSAPAVPSSQPARTAPTKEPPKRIPPSQANPRTP